MSNVGKKVKICHAEKTRNVYFGTSLSQSALFREFGNDNEDEIMYFDSMRRGFEEKIMGLHRNSLLSSASMHLCELYCF